MNNIFQISMKNRFIPKAFALFVIVAVMMPTSMLSLSPSYANAQEAEGSATASSESSDVSSSNSSSEEASSSVSESTPSEESSSPDEKPVEVSAPTDVTSSTESSSTQTIDSTQTASETTDVVTNDTTESTDTTPTNTDGTENTARTAAGTAQTGSITVCKLIVDNRGNIITAPSNTIPVGDFSVSLRDENQSPVGTVEFSSATFAPNRSFIVDGTNDAQCETISNLPLIGFYYNEEVVLGQSRESWQTPRYADLIDVETEEVTLDRMGVYSGELFDNDPNNDENRDQNADGHIVLNGVRPDRVLFVLNRFDAMTYGSLSVCKLIVDQNNAVVTNPANIPAGQFTVDLRNFSGSVVGSQIALTTFNTASFVANTAVIGSTPTTPGTTNDTQCVTYNNLPIGRYYYSEEAGANSGVWSAPQYNDFVTPPAVTTVDTFYPYSGELFDADPNNNENRNVNADGYVILTNAAPNRKVVVLNKFNPGTNPTNTAPVIIIKGDNPTIVPINTEFIDTGVSATDLEDGNEAITRLITATGEVNVTVAGTYTITYSVTDSGGLSDTKTRTVIVQSENIDNDDNNNGGGGGGGSGGRRRAPQGQVLGATTDLSATSCSYLNDYLKQGQQNNPVEVLKLQYFLKYFEGFSALEANGTFDDATFAAVSEFQNRYKSDILTPWGHTAPTGYVYILTKKKVNEIFCEKLFPLTGAQESEVAAFRAMLTAQIANGGSETMIETSEGVKDISDLVGSAYSTSTTITLADDSSDDSDATTSFKSIASAIWSIPTDRGMLLQSLYFLLIAIIAIYLATEIVVGSMNTVGLTKYQVWARKSTAYVIGLVIAIIVALSYKIFSIIIPLILLLIVAGAFLAVAITKRSGDNVISTPPKN